MSFVFEWDKFVYEHGDKIEKKIKEFIKEQKLPDFLDNINIDYINFGNTKPELMFIDIGDAPEDEEIEDDDEEEYDIKSENLSMRSSFSTTSFTSFTSLRPSPSRFISTAFQIANKELPKQYKLKIKKNLYPPPPALHHDSKPTRISHRNIVNEPPQLTEETLRRHIKRIEKEEKNQSGIDIDDILGPKGILIRMAVKYDGNASMRLSAKFVINQPTPRFIVLPVSIKISHIHIESLYCY